MTSADRLTTLYDWLEEMSKAGEGVKDKYENEYKTIIDYVKNSKETKERILAAQLIARFFRFFPAYEEPAFDSIVDLCESVDVDVRKHATMAMIAICRDCKHLVSKAADILIQLYQTNEASESFFTNFEDGAEVVRERALKFLSNKIQTVAESSLTKEVEEQLSEYSKKAMEDVTKDEFITFINILTKLKIAKTATGQAMIVSVIKSQAELDKEFDVNDQDSLDKFLLCARQTIPLLSQYNRASEYVNYICLKILPHLDALKANGSDLNVLQVLAEMCPFIHADDIPEIIDMAKCQEQVFSKLTEYLPLPPPIEPTQIVAPTKTEQPTSTGTEAAAADGEQQPATSGDSSAKEGSAEKTESDMVKPEAAAVTNSESAETVTTQAKESPSNQETKPKQQQADFLFTHIEYLLFTFQQFGHFNPDFYTDALQSSIKLQLHHLTNGCNKYMQILSAQLRVVSSADLKKEENKLKSVALRTTKNISNIVKDLFKRPPLFKVTVLLSCKPLAAGSDEPAARQPSGSSSGNGKAPYSNKGHQNNGSYNNSSNNKGNFNRHVGQKHKYRQSYQNDRNNKRPRQTRL